jgi:hypothetical protein
MVAPRHFHDAQELMDAFRAHNTSSAAICHLPSFRPGFPHSGVELALSILRNLHGRGKFGQKPGRMSIADEPRSRKT